MAKRGPWVLAGLCLLAVLVIIYLNYTYFFNPLTFQQSEATSLPWHWYRNPLQLEYAVLDADGWKITTTRDQAEISLVFRELGKGVDDPLGASETGGRQIWFGVRRLSDGAILLSVDGYEQAAICRVKDAKTIILTEKLQQLLEQRLQEARLTVEKRRASPIET